jgi:hypothetical protein
MQKAGTSKQQADSQWLLSFSSLLKYSLTFFPLAVFIMHMAVEVWA